LLRRIAIYPIFNFAKNHFHENGLWADPTAKYPTEDDGEKRNENDKSKHAHNENEKVLGPKANAEQNVSAF
jgi:hypothetical protein